jgi:hypothetical protein
MGYTTMDIVELLRLATVENAHAQRIQPSIDRWVAYLVELDTSAKSLENEAFSAGSEWPDAAGELFLRRTKENVATIRRKKDAVSSSDVVGKLGQLRDGIHTTYTEVLDAYNQYANQLYPDQAAMDAAAKLAAQVAGGALNKLATLFVSTGTAVTQAAAPGTSWDGPKTGEGTAPGGSPGGAAPAGAGAAPSSAPADGGAAGGGAAGGGAAESAAAGGGGGASPTGAPGGAGAAVSPTGSLSPVGGAGPSLAGLTAPTPVGSLPPVGAPISPNLTPHAPTPTALIPPVSAIRPNLGGLTPGAIRPTGGLGSAAVSGVTSIPKAGTTVAAAATPAAGQAPRAEATGGQAANRPLGTSGTTPMMPPMAGGMGGAGAGGGAPKAGTADPAGRRGRPARTVPGVPRKLRGRAGKVDGKSTFLTPAGRSTSGRHDEDSEATTVQLLDEDLWRVEETHRPLPS